MRRKLTWAVTAALIVLATASPGGASPPRGVPSGRGVSGDTIKLGITYVDLSAIKDVIDIDHGDYEAAYRAVIDDLNKRGINGRTIEPVFAPINPVGTVAADEACVKLTEDEHVFAVVGFFVQDSPLCYLEQHETPIIGGNMTGENLARAKASWFSAESGDVTYGKVMDAFARDGAFERKKVGVVATAQERDVLDDVVRPALERNDVKAEYAVIDVPADDVLAAEQQAGVIAQRFEADDVEVVVAVGGAIQVFATALETSDYRPRLLATSREPYLGYVASPSHDPDVLKRSMTGGVNPDFDEPGYAKCRKVIERAIGEKILPSAEVPEGEPTPDISAAAACVNIGLFAGIAEAAGRRLTDATFARAPQRAASIDIPGFGPVAYDARTRAFDQPIFLSRYRPKIDDVVQDRKPVTLPETQALDGHR